MLNYLVPLIAGGIAGGGQSATQLYLADQQMQFNEEAWNRSVAHEQAVFDRDSAYNSPAMQMQRFKAAGLNPNLIYGQGNPGNTSGRPQSSDSFFPSMLQNFNPFEALGTLMQTIAWSKEMEYKDAQTAALRESASLTGQKFFTEQQKFQLTNAQYEFMLKNYPELLKKIQMENQITEQTMDYDVSAARLRNERIEAEIMNMFKKSNLLDEDLKIKREVLSNKEFQNKLIEIQTKFMQNGEISNGQLFQLIMSVVFKLIQ